MSAWDEVVQIQPVPSTSRSAKPMPNRTELEMTLRPFFPGLEGVEVALLAAQQRSIVRADQLRQQQLEQTIDVLKFHGATAEDISRHVQQQLEEEIDNR